MSEGNLPSRLEIAVGADGQFTLDFSGRPPRPGGNRHGAHSSRNQADFTFQVDGGPADKLRVKSFHGSEHVSRLFQFSVELASLDGAWTSIRCWRSRPS